MYSCQFSKNFPLPKNGGHFEFSNFCQKWKNTKLLLSPKPCEIERFRRNIRPTEYLRNVLLQFSKNFPLPKNGGLFEFLPKMAKHKIASISLTVRDRAISSKFSTHRVSKECSLANFQKNFPFTKMAAILNFRIFAKNGKTQNCIYLLNRAR